MYDLVVVHADNLQGWAARIRNDRVYLAMITQCPRCKYGQVLHSVCLQCGADFLPIQPYEMVRDKMPYQSKLNKLPLHGKGHKTKDRGNAESTIVATLIREKLRGV